MFSKTNIIRIGVLLLYLSLMTIHTIFVFNEIGITVLDINGEMQMYLWWDVQFSGADADVIISLLSLILFTTFGSYTAIYIKNNPFFIFVQQRTGYKQFLKSTFLKTFSTCVCVSVITKVYGLLLISALCKQLPSNVKLDELFLTTAFRDNTWGSWLTFVLLSSIGWGVYAILICAIGLFIKKNSVFLVSGGVIGILLILVPAMTSFNEPTKVLVSPMLLVSLIEPGQLTLFHGEITMQMIVLFYLLAIVIYLGISGLLVKKWVHDTKKMGGT